MLASFQETLKIFTFTVLYILETTIFLQTNTP